MVPRILSVQQVSKSFGNLRALDGISIDVDESKVSILIGPNGSGKTTLINVISGLYSADSGKILFEDRDVTGVPPYKLYDLGMARTFQIPAIFWKLTVLENLLIAEKGNPGEHFLKSLLTRFWKNKEMEATEKASKILDLLGLSRLWNQPAYLLSGGQMKLVEIGRALMSNAKLLLLDEPVSGVNPTLAHEIFSRILKLRDEFGLSFFIVEHRLDIALKYVDEIFAGYGNLQVLNDVSLEAQPNRITVIVGPNGSGKSTLLKTIAGLTSIYQGQVMLDDKIISKRPPHEIARLGIAYLPQTESTFTRLTVSENFKMAGYSVDHEDFRERLERALAIFPKLTSYMNTKVSHLSGGERQMVAMSMALLRKPNTIMFDEPTANLAPIVATQVLNTITYLAQDSDITILLVEQNATRALQIGHSAYLLVNGTTIFQGTAKALLEHPELGRLYLGLTVPQPSS